MHIGAILVLVGVILVAVDLVVARGPRRVGESAAAWPVTLLHVGCILIGVGVLIGHTTFH